MSAPWLIMGFKIFILVGMILSWIGTIIPIFPGPTVMWVLALVYGIVQGFGTIGIIMFVIITLLTVASWLTDNVFSIKGAREGGASWSSVAVASIAGLISSLFMTPIIGVLVTLLVLYLIEFSKRHDSDQAMRATKQMLLGWGWATVVRLGLGFISLALWSAWAWL